MSRLVGMVTGPASAWKFPGVGPAMVVGVAKRGWDCGCIAD